MREREKRTPRPQKTEVIIQSKLEVRHPAPILELREVHLGRLLLEQILRLDLPIEQRSTQAGQFQIPFFTWRVIRKLTKTQSARDRLRQASSLHGSAPRSPRRRGPG